MSFVRKPGAGHEHSHQRRERLKPRAQSYEHDSDCGIKALLKECISKVLVVGPVGPRHLLNVFLRHFGDGCDDNYRPDRRQGKTDKGENDCVHSLVYSPSIGAPQCGHAVSSAEMSPPQSEHTNSGFALGTSRTLEGAETGPARRCSEPNVFESCRSVDKP